MEAKRKKVQTLQSKLVTMSKQMQEQQGQGK